MNIQRISSTNFCGFVKFKSGTLDNRQSDFRLNTDKIVEYYPQSKTDNMGLKLKYERGNDVYTIYGKNDISFDKYDEAIITAETKGKGEVNHKITL